MGAARLILPATCGVGAVIPALQLRHLGLKEAREHVLGTAL